MTQLKEALRKPEPFEDASAVQWFANVADVLLNRTRWDIGGQPHRLTEIEFYYFSKGEHADYFAHRDPLQLEFGRWYFHRMEGTYKAGSFKGLDISFGDGEAHGGILIRGMEKPDGELIDGPSLCVDHILATTGFGHVAALDTEIDTRCVWEDAPMLLVDTDEWEPRELIPSSRVGLTLKRSFPGSNMPYYIARPYRFLTEPRRIKKGKIYMIMTLYAQGYSAADISKITGSPKRSIEANIASFEEGRALEDFSSYLRKDLKTEDLARLHGTCAAHPTE